ncbi:DUF1007 family protein [Neorhizobium sp. T786]|uniref:DUF1007 family protein n=1 Tax=Pseudorhizobium xiangyangii TaxID=2883104 RepID=UPI001D000601|nr:DUF1007 family protein [Neorhizobium xiangyangii]MCB5204302.1 DUF1007 family protein [Neorhizobium xiangyangii]
MKHALPILTALAVSLPGMALAHPHIFAEARMEVIAADGGTVAEVRNVWRFDEMFSSSVLLDFDKNTNLKLDEDELAELGEVMHTSLADFDYFTTVSVDGQSAAMQKPDAIHVSYEDNQILVFFAVKPEKPMPLKGKLAFGIYDPSMYTAIDFPTDKDLVAQGKGADACKHQVVRPDPDEIISQNSETLTEAFFDDPSGNDMSKLFATRLELTC